MSNVLRMGNVLRMCFEPRILAGLAVAGVLVWIMAPSLLAPAIPVLLLAACPLSMLAMAWMMRGRMGGQTADPSPSVPHAAVRRDIADPAGSS